MAHRYHQVYPAGDWWLSGIGMALFGTTIAFADRIWQLSRTPLLATSRPRLTIAVSTMINKDLHTLLSYFWASLY